MAFHQYTSEALLIIHMTERCTFVQTLPQYYYFGPLARLALRQWSPDGVAAALSVPQGLGLGVPGTSFPSPQWRSYTGMSALERGEWTDE